ncbi:MAG TPA: MFS transporter, partial [Nitrospira sp.]|nr:MFS transporter [Nitrospira sp.]
SAQPEGDMAEAHGDTATSTHDGASAWALVKSRDFGLLFAGQTISQIGDSLNKVALLWFVYELTGSALKMTVIGLLQTLPPLVFGPLIGVYLDRFRKKRVMIAVDFVRAGVILLIPLLYFLEELTLERLYVLVFANAVVSTIFGPALASAVPLIVSKDKLITANALMQSTANFGLLVGPPISGVGIALVGAQYMLCVHAATFLVSALCLIPIRMHETLAPRPTGLGWTHGIAAELLAGFRFVFVEQKTVMMLMITAMLYSLGTSAFIFQLPVFAKDVLGMGPVQLGWLWSALGVGMLLASLGLASITHANLTRRLHLISGALAIGGLAVGALEFLESPWAAGAVIALIGGSTAMFTPLVWAVLQELTPAPLSGRVFTSFATGGMASSMAGMAGFGWATDTFGPFVSLGGISLILLVTAVAAGIFSQHKSEMRALAPNKSAFAA